MTPLLFVLALSAVEPGDLVVPALASSGGAVAGVIVATGIASGGLAAQFAFPIDEDAPPDGSRVFLNLMTTFMVLAGPPLFGVVGAGIAGGLAQGLIVALGAGFGTVVGGSAGAVIGLLTVPPGREADGGEAVLEMVARGGMVAGGAALGAAFGGAGAMAAMPTDDIE